MKKKGVFCDFYFGFELSFAGGLCDCIVWHQYGVIKVNISDTAVKIKQFQKPPSYFPRYYSVMPTCCKLYSNKIINLTSSAFAWLGGHIAQLKDVLQKFRIENHSRIALNDQYGARALMDIPRNTCVGQYFGAETLQKAFGKLYEGTSEEYDHNIYAFDQKILVNKHHLLLGQRSLYYIKIRPGFGDFLLDIAGANINIQKNIHKKGDYFTIYATFGSVEFKVIEIEIENEPDEDICIVAPETIIHSNGLPIIRENEDSMNNIGYDDIGGASKVLLLMREMIELPIQHQKYL